MNIQSHYLQAVNHSMQKALRQGKNWLVFDGRPLMTNPGYLKYFANAHDARNEAGIDLSIPSPMRAVLLKPVADSVRKLTELQQTQAFKLGHVFSLDIDKVLQHYLAQRPLATAELVKLPEGSVRLTANAELLQQQLKDLGFTASLSPALQNAQVNNETSFILVQSERRNNHDLAAVLHFRQSVNSDKYVLDHFDLTLKKPGQVQPIGQRFYFDAYQKPIAYPEAVNLIEGRAVLKDLAIKAGESKKVWVQIDFKTTDSRGNFVIKQVSPSAGYDLDALLSTRPIREVEDPVVKPHVIAALERGERSRVTFEQNGNAMKVMIEAAPRFKSLNYYSESNQRINYQQIKAALKPELPDATSRKRGQKISV